MLPRTIGVNAPTLDNLLGPGAPSTLASAMDMGLLDQTPQWALAAMGVLGVVMWLFGHASLKAGFGLIGALVGGLAGYVVPEAMGVSIHPGIGAMLGAGVGLVAALAGFRLSIGITQGAVFAAAAAVAVFLGVSNSSLRTPSVEASTAPKDLELQVSVVDPDEPTPAEPSDSTVAEVREWLKSHAGAADHGLDHPGMDKVREKAAELVASSKELADRVRPAWEELPRADRTAVSLAALGAGIVGLGCGLFFPKRSAGLVTALGGAMLWLPAMGEMLRRSSVAPRLLDDVGPRGLVVAIIAATVIGTMIQWAMTKRPADKA